MVTLACLTTCVGLVSACSQYFSTLLTTCRYKSNTCC
ncbi:branched-chain amino acid transport system II carrier protein [Bacillus sp. D-CC]